MDLGGDTITDSLKAEESTPLTRRPAAIPLKRTVCDHCRRRSTSLCYLCHAYMRFSSFHTPNLPGASLLLETN